MAEEKRIVIDDQGTSIQAMTFNGSIPGPLMVVHDGDYVELTLVNPSTNSFTHNIDFHAATGALGGGSLTLVNPGEQVVLRFKATRTGVFIYHCAPGGDMIPFHVVSGMSGAIMADRPVRRSIPSVSRASTPTLRTTSSRLSNSAPPRTSKSKASGTTT